MDELGSVSPKIKILVDTDIGSEIDDALALAYLASNPTCEIVGVTTISREAKVRAKLASAILRVAGRPTVPICPGHELAIGGCPFHYPVSHASVLAQLDHQDSFIHEDAVMFLRRMIAEHDGQVVLLALGPLTHVAELFQLDVEIPKRLRRLVTMCGNFSGPPSTVGESTIEWNAALDPEAADIVFRTAIPGGHYLIGLETTKNLCLRTPYLARRARSAILQTVLSLHKSGNRGDRPLTVYDLVAAILALKPGAAHSEKGTARFDLAEPCCIGSTTWHPNEKEGQHLLYTSISPCRIAREFLATFKGEGEQSVHASRNHR